MVQHFPMSLATFFVSSISPQLLFFPHALVCCNMRTFCAILWTRRMKAVTAGKCGKLGLTRRASFGSILLRSRLATHPNQDRQWGHLPAPRTQSNLPYRTRGVTCWQNYEVCSYMARKTRRSRHSHSTFRTAFLYCRIIQVPSERSPNERMTWPILRH